MDETIRTAAISPLCQRLIDDMNMRRCSRATRHSYIRDVGRCAMAIRCPRGVASLPTTELCTERQHAAGIVFYLGYDIAATGVP